MSAGARMSGLAGRPANKLGVVVPFWLDRPDEEAVEIAVAAERAGIETVWIGELASFDAFALATAIGLRTERARLKIGPLAIGVRSPVAIALGVGSVATLIGRRVDVALGASSPTIVTDWHDRPWTALAPRMEATLPALRAILDGQRADFDTTHVRAHGFKLRRPQPEASIAVAAFGPAMTRVAARHADEVVLNLVTPEHVARVRARIDQDAAAAGRRCPPRLAVWVPAALNSGERAQAQLAGQLAAYVGAPEADRNLPICRTFYGHGWACTTDLSRVKRLPSEAITRRFAGSSAAGLMLRGGDYGRGLLGFVAVVVHGNHLWTSGGALVIGRRSRAARATPRVRRPEPPVADRFRCARYGRD